MAVLANTGSDWSTSGEGTPLPRRVYGGRCTSRPRGRARALVLGHQRAASACRAKPSSSSLVQLVLGVVLVAMVVIGFGALGVLRGAQQASVPESTALVRVEPGDSLWEVARRAAPNSEPSAVVSRIRELNDLHSSSLYEGQLLTVPVSGTAE